MIQLSENGLKVLQLRYLCKNEQGTIVETAGELFRRVAAKVASAELCWGKSGTAKIWKTSFTG